MFLNPTDICYSQDSINNYFDSKCNHSFKMIGETLDDICEGRCSIFDIPTISVKMHNGRWVTGDNRRLWVFRQLERLGKCSSIQVNQTWTIPDAKMTSYNGGENVRVRRDPGGHWHRKPKYYKPVSHSNTTDYFDLRRNSMDEDRVRVPQPYRPRVQPSERSNSYQYNYYREETSPPRTNSIFDMCVIL